jgi:hypothetical protein
VLAAAAAGMTTMALVAGATSAGARPDRQRPEHALRPTARPSCAWWASRRSVRRGRIHRGRRSLPPDGRPATHDRLTGVANRRPSPYAATEVDRASRHYSR